jgi:hypothetical protein
MQAQPLDKRISLDSWRDGIRKAFSSDYGAWATKILGLIHSEFFLTECLKIRKTGI